MGPDNSYNLAVIGAGPGGYVTAIRAAQCGLKVALIEQNQRLGGTCLNVGCIPSKALLDISEQYYRLGHGALDRGIMVDQVGLDLSRVMAFKTNVVHELTDGLVGLMKAHAIEVFHARARLLSEHTIELSASDTGTVTISSENIVLATGSVPVQLPFLPFNGRTIISSTEALSLAEVPRHLIVIGAGAIGLELGSVWSRFGATITVVELLPEVLPGADLRVSKMLRRVLAKQGFTFHLQTKVTGYREIENGLVLSAVDAKGQTLEIQGDRVLVAVGRRPYTQGLGLENVGIVLESGPGKIPVNDRFQTACPSIYAIGDLINGPMLAHKAEDEGIAVAEIISGKTGHINYDIIPAVVYTAPEVASVGLTEEQVKQQGIAYKTGLFHFRANGRALCTGDAEGFVKIIAAQDTDSLLGVHILGPWASDLIAEAVTVMQFGGGSADIARTIHAHPTLSEALREASMAVENRSIHSSSSKR
ncbi:dihydrolipoyl dehydrogenase [bacterium]|nr:dihydrolipoyl dehydrogenase [bacterium]